MPLLRGILFALAQCFEEVEPNHSKSLPDRNTAHTAHGRQRSSEDDKAVGTTKVVRFTAICKHLGRTSSFCTICVCPSTNAEYAVAGDTRTIGASAFAAENADWVLPSPSERRYPGCVCGASAFLWFSPPKKLSSNETAIPGAHQPRRSTSQGHGHKNFHPAETLCPATCSALL